MRIKRIFFPLIVGVPICVFVLLIGHEDFGKLQGRIRRTISKHVHSEITDDLDNKNMELTRHSDVHTSRITEMRSSNDSDKGNRQAIDTLDHAMKGNTLDNLKSVAFPARNSKEDDQHKRINNLKTACLSNPHFAKQKVVMLNNFQCNDRLNYCAVPKLGTQFFMDFFQHTLHCKRIGKGKKYTKNFSKHVFSFINVGNPYQRLLSAYKNKLFKPDIEFWKTLGSEVVRAVRKTSNEPCGYDVTFAELLQYVTDRYKRGKSINSHLTPIHHLCNPCKTSFDFIGKLETLSADLVDLYDVVKKSGIVKKEVRVSRREDKYRYQEKLGSGTIRKVFDAVKKYPGVDAYKLFLRHWSTYHIGGIILNKFEMPFNESEVKYISQEQYKHAVANAMEKSEDNKEQLKLQRHEALMQAFRSVPLTLMARVREFVMPDCLLFSYDDQPPYLFNRDTFNYSVSHVYMKGL